MITPRHTLCIAIRYVRFKESRDETDLNAFLAVFCILHMTCHAETPIEILNKLQANLDAIRSGVVTIQPSAESATAHPPYRSSSKAAHST